MLRPTCGTRLVRRHQQAEHQEQHDVCEPGEAFVEVLDFMRGRDARSRRRQRRPGRPPGSRWCRAPAPDRTVPAPKVSTSTIAVAIPSDQAAQQQREQPAAGRVRARHRRPSPARTAARPCCQVASRAATIERMTKMVRKIDIGSFRPDSTSSSAVTRAGSARRARLQHRRRQPPRRSAPRRRRAAWRMRTARRRPDRRSHRRRTAVTATPTIASTSAGQNASRSIDERRLQPAFEQDHRERDAADQIGGGEVAVRDAAGSVLAGEHAEDQEHQQHRRAEAARDKAGEDAEQHRARRRARMNSWALSMCSRPSASRSGPMVIGATLSPFGSKRQ